MRFTRTRDLVVAGVVVAVLVNLLLIVQYDSLPPLPVLAGASLLVLAVVELVFAQSLRARLADRRNGRPDTRQNLRPVPPLLAARAVALAKASSLLGAIMFGAWLGVLVYVLPRRAEMISASGDTNSAVVGLVSAAALVAAALWLENSCRTPEDGDDRHDRDDEPGLPRSH